MSNQTVPRPTALIQQASLPTLAQKEIERMILSGELASGDKLNEASLADMLGISRGPVREAFRSLEESGLVQQKKNCGVFVRQISLAEADEIYEIREALDELVGRKLAVAITPVQVKELRSVLAKMEKMVEKKNVEGYSMLNLEFHDLLVCQTGNINLLSTYRRLIKELNLYRRNALEQQGTLPLSIREHHDIIDQIASGNVEAAGKIMRQHVADSRQRMHRAQAAMKLKP
jgi:phosphonate utilization transcriptional regulator